VILTPEQNALLSRGNTTVPVVTIKLKINLDGSSSLQSQIMPVNYQTDKVKVNLSGLTLQTSFSAGLDKVNAVLNLSGVEVITPDAALQVKNLVTNYDGVKNAFDLWLEQRQIACESLQLKSGVNSDLAFNGLSLQSNMTEEKRAIAMRGNFTLANGTFNGLSYTQNILEWDISNLNPEVLAKLREELRDFSNLNQPSMQQGLKIAQYLGQLLNNGLTFDIKQARTHTPWGDFMAAGQIVALPAKNADVFAVLNNLRGDFSLQMESPLAQYLLTQYYAREASAAITPAEQAKNILNNWVQSGSVVLDGNNYKTKLKYDKTFFINDKPIALSVVNETGLRQKKN